MSHRLQIAASQLISICWITLSFLIIPSIPSLCCAIRRIQVSLLLNFAVPTKLPTHLLEPRPQFKGQQKSNSHENPIVQLCLLRLTLV